MTEHNRGELIILPDPAALADEGARRFVELARWAIGDHGRFSVALEPGRYRVLASPGSGQLPSCPSAVKATVRSGRYTRVAIDCDSGIR